MNVHVQVALGQPVVHTHQAKEDSIKTLHMQCKLLGGTFVTAECTQLLTAHQADLRIAALALISCLQQSADMIEQSLQSYFTADVSDAYAACGVTAASDTTPPDPARWLLLKARIKAIKCLIELPQPGACDACCKACAMTSAPFLAVTPFAQPHCCPTSLP